MLNRLWNNLPWYVKNRYVLSLIAFIFWLAFFDQHNLISQIELKAELYQLEKDRDYYQEEIVQIKDDLEELLSDNSKLEKFARERYFMKRDNEEIFVFVEED
ncbi:MAG: septum formation initiator family protein [Flavobacteriales bacterium]